MQSEQTKRLADVVASALECAVAERAQFLSDVCGDSIALREEAESLLRFEESARDFIETPAYDLALEIIPNGTIEQSLAAEPIVQSEASVEFGPELQSPEVERGDYEKIPNGASETALASEPTFQGEVSGDFGSELQSPEIERGDYEKIPNGASETASEPTFQGEASRNFGSELQSPEIERTDYEEIPNGASETASASAPTFQSEVNIDFGSELQSPGIERGDYEKIPNGASETASASEPILQSEASREVGAEPESPRIECSDSKEIPNGVNETPPAAEPTFQNEANIDFASELESPKIERSDYKEIPNGVDETVPAAEAISQSDASVEFGSKLQSPEFEHVDRDKGLNAESKAAPTPVQLSDFGTFAEFGPELQSLVIEHGDPEETLAAAISKQPKPQSKGVPLTSEKAKGSFVIPAGPASEHAASRPAKFVWTKRAAFIVLVLATIAMVIALISALENAKNAQHQRDVALADRARAERVSSYLQQMISFSDQNFTSVWPVPQNRNITVTTMLDRIVPRVQSELADQSDVRGEVLRRIGDAYAAQGDHDAAEKNLRAALQALTAFYGEESDQVVGTMVDLGALLYRREKFPEAERFLEKGVPFLRKQNETEGGRSNAIKLAYALDQLGAVKFYRGDVKAGRAILEEALRVATQAQPREHDRSVLTDIKTDLGGLLVLVGDLIKGEILLEESLAQSRAAANAPQWESGMTLQMLGELALAKNRPREADDNFLAAEKIYRETLGEKNLYFARNLERRATVALLEKDLASAEGLAQRSLAITKECSPQNKLPWTDPMMTLSSILLNEGRAAEGEDYLRKTIRICEGQPMRNYAAISLAKIRLSQLLLSQKRFTEAENLAFEAHNQAKQHLDPQDTIRKATKNNLIEIYEVQEKHEAARAVK